MSPWNWVRMLLHTIYIVSLHSHWPELGSERVGSLEILKGPSQPHLQLKSTAQANSCLKFNPKREGFQVATQSILHVASLDLGFSSKVPMQIFLEC